MSASGQALKRSQRKIDKIARGFDFQTSDKPTNLNIEMERIRKCVAMASNDSFFSYNSTVSMVMGTLMMWVGLAHLSSGFSLKMTERKLDCFKTLINFFIAGSGGALGAHLTSKVMIFLKLRKEKRQFSSYVDIGVDFEQQRAISNARKATYYLNLDVEVDVLLICRGIISGCVAVSVSPSNHSGWASLVSGIVSGIILVLACRLFHLFNIDDTTLISQSHGAVALYSLLSICVFHESEGFLFKQLSENATTLEIQRRYETIMVVVGSNALALLSVFILILVCLAPFNYFVINRFSRISKHTELMGQDTSREVTG